MRAACAADAGEGFARTCLTDSPIVHFQRDPTAIHAAENQTAWVVKNPIIRDLGPLFMDYPVKAKIDTQARFNIEYQQFSCKNLSRFPNRGAGA